MRASSAGPLAGEAHDLLEQLVAQHGDPGVARRRTGARPSTVTG